MKFIIVALAALCSLATARRMAMPDLSDCKCNCPCNKVTHEKKPCDVDMVVLINAAACVKDYREKMKIQAKELVEDTFKKSSAGSFRLRISAITYSNQAKTIIQFNEQITSAQAFDRKLRSGWTDSMQGNGDFLSVGLKGANDMFDYNSQTRKVLMVLTNGGDAKNPVEAKAIRNQARSLRASGVEMFVHTITGYCLRPKDCLMCCPDVQFLTSFLATSDKICSNRPSNGVRASDMETENETGVRNEVNYGYRNFFGHECTKQISYQCPGVKKANEECKKECSCTCDSMRPGIPGPLGIKGRPGRPGNPGRPGDAGVPGKTGYPGMPGSPGQPGTPGLSCVDGKPAPPGRQGPHGPENRPGAPGQPGRPGDNGPEGLAGGFGGKGRDGKQGAPGAAGVRGEAGGPGKAGKPGRPGPPGCKGQQGDFGADGKPGMDGQSGRAGGRGVAGYKGRTGNPGLNGKAGVAGVVGDMGKPGIRGVSGLDGRQGPPGSKGQTGAPGRKGISVKYDYSKYLAMVDAEIDAYLAQFGWKFNCDCHKDDPRCPL